MKIQASMMLDTVPAGEPSGGSVAEASPATPEHALPITEFIWGAGVECSSLPHLNVDQFNWTQHNRYWRDDFRRARQELGLSHLRYAFPWYQLEPARGQYDWSMSDQRLDEMQSLGLQPILDIMHFGTPLWLKQAVGDPEFPEALEEFSQAMVERYREMVQIWSPCNEPLVCALFSGDYGFWPPHSRKWRGYMPVLSRIMQGVTRSIRAIRRAMPDATVLLCDSAENYKTRHASLALEVRRRNLRRFLALDILTGRLDHHHPLYPWVTAYGMSDIDLDWFLSHPQSPDVLGLDYYTHSDWQLDVIGTSVRQHRSDSPVGLYGIGNAYYQRYGIPLMLTETSVEGQPINREIWLQSTVDDARRLREEGIPLRGFIWWPLVDQLDWDGALTHRIGKVHEVGLYNLRRQADGSLARSATPLVKLFSELVREGNKAVGELTQIMQPTETAEDQDPPIGVTMPVSTEGTGVGLVEMPAATPSGNGANGKNGNGHGRSTAVADDVVSSSPVLEAPTANRLAGSAQSTSARPTSRDTGHYGIVVFSHLRWGFVWQRPQQFLSRFARKHSVLFFEEPFFDLADTDQPRLAMHRVMPNVTVGTPHFPPAWNGNPRLPEYLRKFTTEAMQELSDNGGFERPLLWYYSPMDAGWSLGYFENRGIVFDSMDELSQFTGAPKALVTNEERLMQVADVVFTGGYELYLKKSRRHDNVHFFGCGVEFDHFARAQDPTTIIPPDIDFIARPILGWFGVVDERVNYAMVGEIARAKTEWSIAMVGPVVKVDPNLLPHSPNLFWLGQRDYEVLPNYCRAFDVCIMPFALNASTQYINPTKALEYFATGRPVISTPVRDIVRQYSDLVDIAKDTQQFIDLTAKALATPDQQRLQRAMDKARQSSWDSTVKTMQRLIDQAIKKEDRRSQRPATPAPELDRIYQYQSTPGS